MKRVLLKSTPGTFKFVWVWVCVCMSGYTCNRQKIVDLWRFVTQSLFKAHYWNKSSFSSKLPCQQVCVRQDLDVGLSKCYCVSMKTIVFEEFHKSLCVFVCSLVKKRNHVWCGGGEFGVFIYIFLLLMVQLKLELNRKARSLIGWTFCIEWSRRPLSTNSFSLAPCVQSLVPAPLTLPAGGCRTETEGTFRHKKKQNSMKGEKRGEVGRGQ